MRATAPPASPVRATGRAMDGAYWLPLLAFGLVAIPAAGLLYLFVILPPKMAHSTLHPPRQVSRITPADLGLPYEDLTIAGDGIDLSGWYLPAQGRAAV